MGKTVRELLASLDSSELTYWRAFDAAEPIGGPAADYRAGLIATATYNVHLKEGRKPLEPLELFPWAQSQRVKEVSDDEFLDIFDRSVGLR